MKNQDKKSIAIFSSKNKPKGCLFLREQKLVLVKAVKNKNNSIEYQDTKEIDLSNSIQIKSDINQLEMIFNEEF